MVFLSAASWRVKAAIQFKVIVRAAQALSTDSRASRCRRAAHRFLRIAFRHLGTLRAVLTTAENIPGHDELAGNIIALADESIRIEAVRGAPLK